MGPGPTQMGSVRIRMNMISIFQEKLCRNWIRHRMTQNSSRNHRIGPAGTLEVRNQPFTHQLVTRARLTRFRKHWFQDPQMWHALCLVSCVRNSNPKRSRKTVAMRRRFSQGRHRISWHGSSHNRGSARAPRATDQTMLRPKTKRISNKLASARPSPISF